MHTGSQNSRTGKPVPEHLRRLGQFPIDEDHAGERLDYYLSKEFPFFTRNVWQQKIEGHAVFINRGEVKRPSYKLKIGDEITMYYPRHKEPRVDLRIRKLFEVDGVMALYKPSGLPMHENGPYLKNTLSFVLRERFGEEWAAVHRLDRETSGIVIAANRNEYRSKIAVDLAKRQIKKSYLAIVEGIVREDAFSEEGALGSVPGGSKIRIKKWVNELDGLPSHTDFEVLERGPRHTLVRAFPRTGRTNQIRIHLAVNGHRIVGDKLYHPNENVFLEYYEKGDTDWVVREAGFSRLCLHAEAIEFEHPKTSELVEARNPLPPDMNEFWQRVRGPVH